MSRPRAGSGLLKRTVVTAVLFFLCCSSASLASPSRVRSTPTSDPVSAATADALGVVNYYGALAVAEYLQGLQRAEDDRAAENARLEALRAAQPLSVTRTPLPVNSSWETFAACVIAHESGGNPTAANPTSSASGLFQDLDSTWGGYGGYSRAMYAPVSVQYERNYQLWNGGAGAGHWAGTGC